LIAGVHKGFTAPSNVEGVQEEEALNYEFGIRHRSDSHRVEMIGFLSDYDNLLGECTASSGANCEIGDAFNGDAVTVRGVEFIAGTELAGSNVPMELAYTYIDGSFDTDIADTAFFGDVSAGDPIPYIPKHQLYAMIGFVQPQWAVHLSANFVDETCVRAACGVFEMTDSSFTVDIAGRWSVNDNLGLFARVENLADSSDIVGLHPYGARPNKSRTALVGLDLSF
jgi:Fe(3+) dicitrate transport protein